jgi:hypothetical protein
VDLAAGPDGDDEDADYEEMDIDNIQERLERMQPNGTEVWLDTLITAIERECDIDESIFTDVLRTSDMQELNEMKKEDIKRDQPPALTNFHRNMSDILQILEHKAKTKYFEYLELQSLEYQRTYESQNVVLHEYVCELEDEFKKIMEKIHTDRAKRNIMLKKLDGLLGKEHEHAAGGKGNQDVRPSHLARLTMPWPKSEIPQTAAGGKANNRGR